MASLKNEKTQLLVLIFLAFIWGSSFILIKKSLVVFTDMEVAAMRIFIASLVLVPWGIKRIYQLSKQDLINITLSGFIGTSIPAFLFTIAQKHITSSEASIYNSLTPLFTLLFAIWLFNTRIHWLNAVGIFVGLIGAIFLITQQNQLQPGHSANPEYGTLLILATIMYGYNTNHIKIRLHHIDGLTIVSVSFLIMLLPALAFLVNPAFFSKISHPHFIQALVYIIVLSVIGTSVALIIWNKLIKHISAIYASTVTYIIAIFALGWGLLDGEKFNINHLISILCIFTGIYLVNYKRKNGV